MTPWQHALLTSMDGPALVCASDASVVAWNAEAARLLVDDEPVAEKDDLDYALQDASLLQWVSRSTWSQLQAATVEQPVAFIVQLKETPRRLRARALTPNDTPHWLIRCESPPSMELDPSHDLLRDLIERMRTPLASIRAAVETMQQYPSMGADAASQFTDVIAGQSVRLTEMIETAGATYTAMYRTRRALEPIGSRALLTWVRDTLQRDADIPVDADFAGDPVAPIRIDPKMMEQGLRFVGDRLVNAGRCAALEVRLQRSGDVVLLDLIAKDGETITEARVDTWKQKTIPWGTTMMQLTLQALLDQHDAQLWVEQADRGSILRFAFPSASSS